MLPNNPTINHINILFSVMPRKYKRKSTRGLTYTQDRLQQAMAAVASGVPFKRAYMEFGIPRNTLRRHLRGETTNVYGGQTILTEQQETALEERIYFMCNRGFPLTIDDLRQLAFLYCKKLLRRKQILKIPKTWFQQKKASYDWWYGFKERHPRIAVRVAENLSAARAEAFNPDRVSAFYNSTVDVTANLGIYDEHPGLVYNCDETGLSSVPNSNRKVIAMKGSRVVQKITVGERGTLTTVLPCSNAAGDFIPPFLIFKGQPPEVVEGKYPEGTSIHGSAKGYIDHEIFVMFLRHFEQHRLHIENKKAILFLDGHGSHLSVEAIDFCLEKGIELICLPPHSSHRLQPLDTHFNKTLKSEWSKHLGDFLKQSKTVVLPKWHFYIPFQHTWDSMTKRRALMVSAFEYCGLFPLKNPTVPADFHKCKNFEPPATKEAASTSASNSSLVRTLVPSPNKSANPAHKRPHEAHATSLQFRTKKALVAEKRKVTLAKVLPKPSMVVPKSPTMNQPGSICQQSASQVPSTSKSRSIPKKSAVKNHVCVVCSEKWVGTTVDWLLCRACNEWACEDCFGSIYCANCTV